MMEVSFYGSSIIDGFAVARDQSDCRWCELSPAAIQFGISAATAVRWRGRHKQTGHFEAMARGGNTRVWKLDDHYGVVMGGFEANRDATLAEMCAALAHEGILTTKSSLDQLFMRRGFTRKKDWACDRARSTRCSGKAAWMVCWPTRYGPRALGVHRRNIDPINKARTPIIYALKGATCPENRQTHASLTSPTQTLASQAA
jgi:transposase